MDAMRNVAVDPSLLYERVREHRKGVHYVHPSICAEIVRLDLGSIYPPLSKHINGQDPHWSDRPGNVVH